jgi:hypothetical protein
VSDWRLLSNHGRVLAFVSRTPPCAIADATGITERSAHRIVASS